MTSRAEQLTASFTELLFLPDYDCNGFQNTEERKAKETVPIIDRDPMNANTEATCAIYIE